MSSKAMSKFGVSFRDMLKDTLTVDKSTSSLSAALDPLSFDVFWNTLACIESSTVTGDESAASVAMRAKSGESRQISQANAELMNFITSLLTQLTIMIKKKTGGLEEIQPLINTSTFLALHYRLDGPNQSVLEALKNLQKQHQSQGRPFPAIEEATKLLTKVLENGLQVDGLVRVASNVLLSSEEIKATENFIEFPALDPCNVVGGESMKIWSRLKESISNVDTTQNLNDNISVVINCILQNMRALAKTFKISPELSSTQLLALLHMASTFLGMWTKCDVNLLLKAYQTLETDFFTWPRPSCDAVVDVLKMMRNEIRSRGYSLMGKFLHESRIPQMKFAPGGEEFWAQPIFCFMDSTSVESAKLHHLLKMQNFCFDDDKPDVSIVRGMSTYTQLHLILQLLSSNLPNIPQATLIDVLTRVNQSKLTDIFYSACVASYEGLSIELGDLEAAEHVSRRMLELWRVIQTLVLPKSTFEIAPQSLLYPPTLPSVVCLSCVDNLPNAGFATRMALVGAPAQYPSTTYGLMLQKLIRYHVTVKEPKDPAIIRIFLCGSDRLMHSVVCGYLSICKQMPETLQGIELKWFVVPIEQDNSIAAFIARHDAWYHRYIFQPFRIKTPIIPWTKMETPSFHYEESSAHVGNIAVGCGGFYKELLESYARESRNSINIVLHEILGFMDESPTAQLAVPFLCRVELSNRSQAMGKKKHEGESRSVEEIINKDRSFKPPNVTLSYFKAGMASDLRVISREDPLDMILLSNVPVAKDKCFPSDPTKPGVELYAKYNEAKISKNCPLEDRCTVANLEITSIVRSEKFYILVDGEPYGPFQRVLLVLDETVKRKLKNGMSFSVTDSPSEHDLPEGHSTSSIPIQTFFPISL